MANTASFTRETLLGVLDRAINAAVKEKKDILTKKNRDAGKNYTEKKRAAMKQYKAWIKVLQKAVEAGEPLRSDDDMPPHPLRESSRYYYRNDLIYVEKPNLAAVEVPDDYPQDLTRARNLVQALEPGSTISLSGLTRVLGLPVDSLRFIARFYRAEQEKAKG